MQTKGGNMNRVQETSDPMRSPRPSVAGMIFKASSGMMEISTVPANRTPISIFIDGIAVSGPSAQEVACCQTAESDSQHGSPHIKGSSVKRSDHLSAC